MADAASPPGSLFESVHGIDYDEMEDQLDDDIAQVRAQIDALTTKRKILQSSILSSTKVQARLRQRSIATTSDDLAPLLAASEQHSQSNVYRLAFGVTAFPFRDPNPETLNQRFLGIRFDVCNRQGRFETPYFIVCKRMREADGELRIHKHTIPELVPVAKYEKRYLPLQDEGYGSEDSAGGATGLRQDLHSLVRRVRRDLAAWVFRRDAINILNENLGLSASEPKEKKEKSPDEPQDEDTDMPDFVSGRFGVVQISPTAVEARYARIVWSDGRVGRIKISNKGRVNRVVIVGEGARRQRHAERILMSTTIGDVSMASVARKLEILQNVASMTYEDELQEQEQEQDLEGREEAEDAEEAEEESISDMTSIPAVSERESTVSEEE